MERLTFGLTAALSFYILIPKLPAMARYPEYPAGHQFYDIPIPTLPSVDGWKEIEIVESDEPLVCIKGLSSSIISLPQYFAQRIPGSIKECYLRKTAVERLLIAGSMLPEGFKLVIWDAWRPLAVQQALFEAFKNRLKNEQPGLSEPGYDLLTQKYVSMPSTNPQRPSPHNTGGAVDLTIQDSQGNLLSMGTAFDYFGTIAATRHCEDLPEARQWRENRRLLYWLMTGAGFTNYHEEWWHFDYGNQFWAKQKGVCALYGAIEL